MIDHKTAAKIAKKHGLGLPDARAISQMAESEEEAEELAQSFAPDEGKQIADSILQSQGFGGDSI